MVRTVQQALGGLKAIPEDEYRAAQDHRGHHHGSAHQQTAHAFTPQAQQQPEPSSQPQFRVPTGQADDGTLRMPEPDAQQRQAPPQQQPVPGGLGGGILGDILGGLRGGGRR